MKPTLEDCQKCEPFIANLFNHDGSVRGIESSGSLQFLLCTYVYHLSKEIKQRLYRRTGVPAAMADKLQNAHCVQSADGGLHLSGVSILVGGRHHKISPGATFAMACTDHCSYSGYGKVYLTLPWPSRKTEVSLKSLHQLGKAPELFWCAYEWTDKERSEWQGMDLRQRLCHVSALAGWLSNDTPVLPFALHIDEKRRSKPQFSALSSQVTTVFLSPQPYVAFTRDLQNLCEVKKVLSRDRDEPANILHDAPCWTLFDPWRIENGLGGILDTLNNMWRTSKTFATTSTGGLPVTRFGTIRKETWLCASEAFSRSEEDIEPEANEDW